jgi:hypothetical protein
VQKGQLLEKLAQGKLKIDDVSTAVKYKGKDDDGWQDEGIKLVARITTAFGGGASSSIVAFADSGECHSCCRSAVEVLGAFGRKSCL